MTKLATSHCKIRAGYAPILVGHFRNTLTYFCRAVDTEIVHLSGTAVYQANGLAVILASIGSEWECS